MLLITPSVVAFRVIIPENKREVSLMFRFLYAAASLVWSVKRSCPALTSCPITTSTVFMYPFALDLILFFFRNEEVAFRVMLSEIFSLVGLVMLTGVLTRMLASLVSSSSLSLWLHEIKNMDIRER